MKISKSIQKQILGQFPNSRFFDTDPRPDPDWNLTHDWIVYKHFPQEKICILIDVGYGYCALVQNGTVVDHGKDMVRSADYVWLGEYYDSGRFQPGGTLAKIVNEIQ